MSRVRTVKQVRVVDYTGCGYLNAIIGGFLLIIQGILTLFSATEFVSELSVLRVSGIRILNGLLMIALGILVLLLVWDWLQIQLKIGTWIKNFIILGIVLIIIGLVAGGAAGILILIAGILYIVGEVKSR